ncbi:unnamed protein product [Rotaria magnacalcarata]|uniref:PDZ and LIM domain protein Zasp n=1 Tax=Rotaria magnacalcarata TaxID=392030 RepID=A0A816STP4_9BILA|nr:unnamed protein product [Rotaria magnacalcarata]CAF3752994.1 unnamed protein product [Rotaria magnacalcarata]
MSTYTMLHVTIQRDSNSVSWGFRMAGGRDHGCPLQIQAVNPNSLGERCGMRANDYILRIGQISAEFLQHQEAHELIKRQSNVLDLILQRGAVPTTADYNSRANFPTYQPAQHRPPAHVVPQPQYQPPPQHHSSQIPMPISHNRVVISSTSNTPIGLYSAENIKDTIERTLKSIDIASDHHTEQSKSVNNYQPVSSHSMPKPIPYDESHQQPSSIPHVSPAKPITTENASINKSSQEAAVIGPRIFKKGIKGSASLNPNDNINQVAICYSCGIRIRGPFISAMDRCYCVEHFTCSRCSTNLMECGFVEENGKLCCEFDFEQYLAPFCAKCGHKILKECIHALEKTWHPECFVCTACQREIGNGSFHVKEGHPYCINDYQRMFQVKCSGCEFPIEPGDKYLEAMGGTYHAECFTCTLCQVSLDGEAFVAKNNKPYCRQHGRPTFTRFN